MPSTGTPGIATRKAILLATPPWGKGNWAIHCRMPAQARLVSVTDGDTPAVQETSRKCCWPLGRCLPGSVHLPTCSRAGMDTGQRRKQPSSWHQATASSDWQLVATGLGQITSRGLITFKSSCDPAGDFHLKMTLFNLSSSFIRAESDINRLNHHPKHTIFLVLSQTKPQAATAGHTVQNLPLVRS